MGGSRWFISWLAATAFLLGATAARAQRPVCAPLGPAEAVQPVCAPFSLFPAVRFVADFTVDHLFKPAPPAVQRTVLETGQLFAAKQIGDNPALQSFLAALAPVRFLQLDRTTGTVLADFHSSPREFEGPVAGVEDEATLTLRMPGKLQGGYWRAPDVLQIAFWEHARVALHIAYSGRRVFDAEVECVALSPDGLLVRFTPSQLAPVLVRFRECDQ